MDQMSQSAADAENLWDEAFEGAPTGPRVLIVDDDLAFRTAIRRMLDESGFEVVGEVGWGELGSTLSAAVEPDVVLMDYQMEGGNGIEATRAIKAAQPLTQVLMISAFDDGEIRREAEEAGAFAYITKGSSPSLVRDRLLEAWEHKLRLSREAGQPAADDESENSGADSTN